MPKLCEKCHSEYDLIEVYNDRDNDPPEFFILCLTCAVKRVMGRL